MTGPAPAPKSIPAADAAVQFERVRFEPHGAWVERRVTVSSSGGAILDDVPPDLSAAAVRCTPRGVEVEVEHPQPERSTEPLQRQMRQLESEDRADRRVRDHWERLMEVYRQELAAAWLRTTPRPDSLADWLQPLREFGMSLAQVRAERTQRLEQLRRAVAAQQAHPRARLRLRAHPGRTLRVSYYEPRAGFESRTEGWWQGDRLELRGRVRLWQRTHAPWHVRTVRWTSAPVPEDMPRFRPAQLAAQRGLSGLPWPGAPLPAWPRSGARSQVQVPPGGAGRWLDVGRRTREGRSELAWWPGAGPHPFWMLDSGPDAAAWGEVTLVSETERLGRRTFRPDGSLPLGEEAGLRISHREEPAGASRSEDDVRHLRLVIRSSLERSAVVWCQLAEQARAVRVVRAEPELAPDPEGAIGMRLWVAAQGRAEAHLWFRRTERSEP